MPSSTVFTRRIDSLTLNSCFKWVTAGVFFITLVACESEEKKENRISKEHAALIGTWEETDSLDTVVWVFDQYEVKRKGFTHAYHVSGDSVIISGLVYSIMEQSDKQMKWMNLSGKACTLNRKD